MNFRFILISAFILVPALSFGEAIVKTCNATLPSLNGSTTETKATFQIVSSAPGFKAKISQLVDGRSFVTNETASLATYAIRPGISAASNDMTMNFGERLIAHAMMLTEDPILKGTFATGLSLKNVSSVRVYTIGKFESMGGVAIIEGFNNSGKNLGSFVGGFMVAPCKTGSRSF